MTRDKFFDPEYICHEPYKTKKHKKAEYINLSAAFDIETTSFKENGSKRGTMYAFVFGVNGKVIFGRTWKDFTDVLQQLQKNYGLSENKILPVYVHNLSFEFQFICKRLKWLDVFATDERKPIRALCDYGIEFRDSYILSGMGLEGTGRNLTKYKIEKLKGDLDYSLPRHSKTPLTPKEWHYIENDGLVLMAFIQEEIEKNHNNIASIPMTKTGYVRKYMRNQCYHGGQAGHGERRKLKTRDFGHYRRIMKKLILTPEEYLLAVECFQGGFTHANSFNVGLIFNDVASEDLTSAYPATMVLDRNYPMGKGTYIAKPTPEEITKLLKLYACFFRIRIWGIMSKFKGDNFLSFSKCRNVRNCEKDNGRVLSAEYLETSITDIDLDILRAFYDFEKVQIFDFWYYPRGYLPRNFIKGVLGLYADKTTLKGVEGMEAEYLLKKELLNSCYGMSVTSLVQPMNKFDGQEWSHEEPNLEETLKTYNETENRFLFYLWGIVVTCNVRRTIARSILELGDDYIYSDTDSVKFVHFEKHKRYFDDYNALIKRKIAASSYFNGLDVNLFQPKTKEGVEKPIGVFDYEGTYKRFKTLGAKRYFVEYPEKHKMKTPSGEEIETEYSLTISGVNKTYAIPALIKLAAKEGKDIFNYFEIGQLFDTEMAGKNTHSYCDFEIEGTLTDYKGKKGKYHEYTFMHLEPTTYKLTTTEEFYENIYMDELERIIRRERKKL